MKRKRASEIFGSVDPNLHVIDASSRRRNKRRLTNQDWDNAEGVTCPNCHNETLRIVNGVCPRCNHSLEAEIVKKQEDKAMRRYYRQQLNKGTISLSQMRENRY